MPCSPSAGGTVCRAAWPKPHDPAYDSPAEVSPARGGPSFDDLRGSSCPFESWRTLYPDPIRSNTSCRETAAPSMGGFARVLRALREYRRCPALPAGGGTAMRSHLTRPRSGEGSRARDPRHPRFREDTGTAEGRALRTTAKRSGGCCTRGAFHR